MGTELETAPDASLLEAGGLASAYTSKAAEVADATVVANPDYSRWAVENNVEVSPTVAVSDMGADMKAKLDPVMNPASGGIVTQVPPERDIVVAGDSLAATPAPDDGLGLGFMLDTATKEVAQLATAGIENDEVATPAPSLAPAPAPSMMA